MFQGFRDRRQNPSVAPAAPSDEGGRRPEVARASAQGIVQEQAIARASHAPRRGAVPAQPHPNPVARQTEMVARRAAQLSEGTKVVPEIVDSKEGQKLVVGPRIRLKGEVSNCDMLIVEGHFEGTAKSRVVQVAQGGSYQGEAEVERAEMSGKFDGSLTVGNRLVIRASGRVSGTIQYFGIEVEEGGQISGNIQVIADEGGGAAIRAAKPEDEADPTSHEAAS